MADEETSGQSTTTYKFFVKIQDNQGQDFTGQWAPYIHTQTKPYINTYKNTYINTLIHKHKNT